MTLLAEQIELLFERRGYQWKFNDGLRCPTAEDIDRILTQAKATIQDMDEPFDCQLEIGRLIVRKSDGHFDVYVYFGELTDG